ncbi:hypothetical protein E7T06_04675 [Deinococcus sp. Arct2-2]|uniref:hypothetical protein n=1 Tax=Deinococcus sp. Arct2-2 TaxID=2568653 RepID=UPI0010A4FDAB|nr:hypothetical protein [Deinococcus sp. Arct2-2]THF71100.1 hypothetical protein E7T06_04675 [Deinococcus sp. Arct2-2]
MTNPMIWRLSLDCISISEIRRWPERSGPEYPHRVSLNTRGHADAVHVLNEFVNGSWLQDADLQFLPELLNLAPDGGGVNLREEGTAVRQGGRVHIYPSSTFTPGANVSYAEFCEVVRLNLIYLELRRFWIERPQAKVLPVAGLPYYDTKRGFRVRQIK